MKRVLVTAINNLPDQQLVEHLISQNFIVRIVAEKTDAGNALLQLPVEIYPGNLSDAATVARAAKGCDYAIQTPQTIMGKNKIKEYIHRLNETLNLVDAAYMAGVKTVLHINCALTKRRETSSGRKNNILNQSPASAAVQPMLDKVLFEATKPAMKIIMVQTNSNDQGNNAGTCYNYATQVVKIMVNGLHANTYAIGDSEPLEKMNWSRRLSGYLHIPGNNKLKESNNLNTSKWAVNLSRFFGSLFWCQGIMQSL